MPSQTFTPLKLPELPGALRSRLQQVSSRAAPDGPGYMRVKAAAADTVELLIYGDIGANWWGEETVTARSVVEALAASDARAIDVRINSYGGVVSDGIAIYNELRRHAQAGRTVTVTVDGVACSIASLIAAAGDTVRMPANALQMLHAPWGTLYVDGNATQIRELAEEFAGVLDVMGKAMSTAYARKTGRPASEFDALWAGGKDHWYTADEAHAFGLCDEVLGEGAAEQFAANADALAAAQRLIARAPAEMLSRIRGALSPSFNANSGQRRGESPMPEAQIPLAQQQQILAEERDRVHEIQQLASPYLASAENGRAVGDAMRQAIAAGTSPQDFGLRVLSIIGAGREPIGSYGFARQEILEGGGHGSALVRAASDVLAMRGGIVIDEPHPGVRDMRSQSISAIARACLSRTDQARGLSGAAAIRAAMTTSDFPAILGDTIEKALRRGYEQEPGTHSLWVRRTFVPDFKEQSRAILGAMPDLLPVLEGGEYTRGAIDEDKSVPFKVEKFGRIIEITWEALVNDDLGALTRIPQGLGQAARRKEADLVYSLFDGSGQTMQDGTALFHANHGNLASSSMELDESALAKGRLLLRKQTSVGGGALNLTPKFLIVPPELESAAEKVLAASSIHVSAGLENATPEWIRRLQLVVESRLPSTAAYLLADNNQIDTVELATLESEEPTIGRQIGPNVSEEDGFDNDTKKYKVRLVAGARVLDWRGMVKLPIG